MINNPKNSLYDESWLRSTRVSEEFLDRSISVVGARSGYPRSSFDPVIVSTRELRTLIKQVLYAIYPRSRVTREIKGGE